MGIVELVGEVGVGVDVDDFGGIDVDEVDDFAESDDFVGFGSVDFVGFGFGFGLVGFAS